LTVYEDDANHRGMAHEYARELHAAADELRRGTERWRLPAETSRELAARLGSREWVYPSAEFAQPYVQLVAELAARLDAIAVEVEVGAREVSEAC
jgi:hypothetical protein